MNSAHNHKRDLRELIEKESQRRDTGHDSGIETDRQIQCDHAVEVIGQYRSRMGKYGVLML